MAVHSQQIMLQAVSTQAQNLAVLTGSLAGCALGASRVQPGCQCVVEVVPIRWVTFLLVRSVSLTTRWTWMGWIQPPPAFKLHNSMVFWPTSYQAGVHIVRGQTL